MIDTLERLFPHAVAWYWNARVRADGLKRLYDAAKASDYRGRRGTGASGDAVMQHAGNRLREAARYYDENTDFAVAILDDLVNSIVGHGVTIEPMVRRVNGEADPGVNEQIRTLWSRYWRRPDVTGEIPGVELERLVARTLFRDGELFGVHHNDAAAPFPTSVPYVLELLEADYCPFDLVAAGESIVHGIEKNAWNRPVAYHFYKHHPGSATVTRASSAFETKRVPARRVIHPKIVRRLGQTRGVTVLHSVLNRIDDIKDGEESERIAMRVAAAFCAIITNGTLAGHGSAATDDGQQQFKMMPGTIFRAGAGERVDVIDSKRPNTGLADFLTYQVRRLAAGTGARFSAIAKDYNGSYSSQRQELVEAKLAVRRYLSYLIEAFYRPVREQFLTAAVLNGDLTLSLRTDRATLVDAEYRGPAIPWIDPVKEMNGYKIARELGVLSRQMVIRDMGNEPDSVDQQIAQDTMPAPAGAGLVADVDDDEEEAAA